MSRPSESIRPGIFDRRTPVPRNVVERSVGRIVAGRDYLSVVVQCDHCCFQRSPIAVPIVLDDVGVEFRDVAYPLAATGCVSPP